MIEHTSLTVFLGTEYSHNSPEDGWTSKYATTHFFSLSPFVFMHSSNALFRKLATLQFRSESFTFHFSVKLLSQNIFTPCYVASFAVTTFIQPACQTLFSFLITTGMSFPLSVYAALSLPQRSWFSQCQFNLIIRLQLVIPLRTFHHCHSYLSLTALKAHPGLRRLAHLLERRALNVSKRLQGGRKETTLGAVELRVSWPSRFL